MRARATASSVPPKHAHEERSTCISLISAVSAPESFERRGISEASENFSSRLCGAYASRRGL